MIEIRYMCLKWSARELWSENFEILIFIECRTLNYIGPMTCRFFHSHQNICNSDHDLPTKSIACLRKNYKLTCREFISKHVESIASKIDPELDIVDEIERQVKKHLSSSQIRPNDPKAASGRLLFLLDGLDEITGVASLSRCTLNILLAPPFNIMFAPTLEITFA